MFKQPLQQKQITDGKRLVLADRKHVVSQARESGKDFAWGALAVPIEGGVERGRTTLGDRLRDPSRMFIRLARTLAGFGPSCCLFESSNGSGDLRRSLGKIGEIHT